MRKPRLVVAMLIAATTLAFSQTTSAQTATKTAMQSDNAEQAVLQLTSDWLAAEERHDRATLQRIIADDFQGIAPIGNTVFKEDLLPEQGATTGGLSLNASELKARVFGDTAVVTARGIEKSGEKRELRFTVVFTRRDNRWQMVAAHLSAIPTSPRFPNGE